jgi:uncharacterized protein YegP (UPF0339 family)
MKKFFWPAVTGLAAVALGFLLFTCNGCVTTPQGQRVSPTALHVIEAVVCTGSSIAVQQDPALLSTLRTVNGYLTAWLDVPGTQFDTNDIVAKVDGLRGISNAPWLSTALGMLTSWIGDLESFKEVGLAIRDGLNCAGARGVSTRTTGFKGDVVVIFKAQDGEFYWRRVAPNGRIVSVWGEGSKRKWNCERSAKKVNPGLPIVFL